MRNLSRTPFPDKLRFAPDDTWEKVLAKLAPAVAKPIFSDGYTAARGILPYRRRSLGGDPIRPLSLSATPHGGLASGLDALCLAYNMVWWQQNGALFFRSRTWMSERRYETPVTIRAQLLTTLRSMSPSDTSLPRYGSDSNGPALLQTLRPLSLQQLEGLAGTDKRVKKFPFSGARRSDFVFRRRFAGSSAFITVLRRRSSWPPHRRAGSRRRR